MGVAAGLHAAAYYLFPPPQKMADKNFLTLQACLGAWKFRIIFQDELVGTRPQQSTNAACQGELLLLQRASHREQCI